MARLVFQKLHPKESKRQAPSHTASNRFLFIVEFRRTSWGFVFGRYSAGMFNSKHILVGFCSVPQRKVQRVYSTARVACVRNAPRLNFRFGGYGKLGLTQKVL